MAAAAGAKGGSAAPNRVTHRVAASMNTTGSGLAAIVDVLRGQLAVLDEEVKADAKGVRDFEIQLEHLAARRVHAEKRLKANKEWAAAFDKDFGPFVTRYHNLTNDIHSLYTNAKEEHHKGIDVLREVFEYHPEFKRFNDQFSAVPFVPK